MTDEDLCGEPTNEGGTCSFTGKYPDGKCGHHTKHNDANTGRPGKLKENREIIDLIGDEIEQGATIAESLAEVEQKTGVTIARSTHGKWMAKGKRQDGEEIYQKYRSEVRRARTKAAQNDRKLLTQTCREQGDTRTWYKVHKEQYGDLYAEDMLDDDDATPVFNVPEDIVDKWQPVEQ